MTYFGTNLLSFGIEYRARVCTSKGRVEERPEPRGAGSRVRFGCVVGTPCCGAGSGAEGLSSSHMQTLAVSREANNIGWLSGADIGWLVN